MIHFWHSFTGWAAEVLPTLVGFEFRATLVILLVLIFDTLLRPATPRFRYALWLVALAGALWPPSLVLSALDIWGRQPVIMETLAPVLLAPITIANATAEPGLTINWATLALLLWGVMSASILALMAVNFVRFRLGLRPPHIEPWQHNEPETPAGRPWPPVWTSDRIHSPLALGLLRPRIYLTWQAIRSGKAAVKAILYHELAHILRRDGWVSLLQAAALVIHPFNPLVWLMNARLSRYREQLCDDFALKHTGVAPRDYGNMLLDQLSQVRSPLFAVHTPTYFFETKRDLVHRLQQLMKRQGRHDEYYHFITESAADRIGGGTAVYHFAVPGKRRWHRFIPIPAYCPNRRNNW
ncbi:MAG: M56 family metallopeptidase [Candidatus Brocadiales bacterium]|nr:M56 family metallopeptidase [Candidatus Bathyanammoxibius sp.]